MIPRIRVSDVFKTSGLPTITYVQRNEGALERALTQAIDSRGRICLVTGPSKTGKTTLYQEVLKTKDLNAVVVQCDGTLTPTEFWRRALEHVDFSQIKQEQTQETSQSEGKFKLAVGWKWLASILGEINIGLSHSDTESVVRERILSSPSQNHIIPILKRLPFMLVVEDFHYLSDETKKVIFQQLKNFSDSEVSVIVLGTSHRAIDIAQANKDLIGRISQIDVTNWHISDLEKIVISGFSHLGLKFPEHLSNFVAEQSFGLPIITQQCCAQIIYDQGLSEVVGQLPAIPLSKITINSALHNAAKMNYGYLENYYQRIIVGPRKRARKYDTYELVLLCFRLDPPSFALPRHEIEKRLDQLSSQNKNLRPPPASITSMLGALARFQKRQDFELLEWRPADRTLYIIEPTFLFYICWREDRNRHPEQLDLWSFFVQEKKESDVSLSELYQKILRSARQLTYQR